jgi:hypothetical protein
MCGCLACSGERLAEIRADLAAVPALPAPGKRPFPARYPGRCAACGEAIFPGDQIMSGGGNTPRWQHLACPLTG